MEPTKNPDQKLALYFGCWNGSGHYVHKTNGETVWDPRRDIPGFPWTMGLVDTGLLKNGNRRDTCDGKVYWTCGGIDFWYAFFWWDRSVDSRGGSNSGLYVRGFEFGDIQAAFDYACSKFPRVISRQKYTLCLQN